MALLSARRSARLGAFLVPLVALLVPSAAAPVRAAPGGVDFSSTFDGTSISPWQGIQYEYDRPRGDSFRIVSSPTRSGNGAAMFVARQGYSAFGYGEDSVLCCGPQPGETEGGDYWYAWSTMFAKPWYGPYRFGIFAQWHSDFGIPPPLDFNVGVRAVSVQLHSGAVTLGSSASWEYERTFRLLNDVSPGRWHDFVVHVHWSAYHRGSVTVWHRLEGESGYALLLRVANVPTLQRRGKDVSRVYTLFGIYRASYCEEVTPGCTSPLGVQPDLTLYQDEFERSTVVFPWCLACQDGGAGARRPAPRSGTAPR